MSDPVDNSVPYPHYAALKEGNAALAKEYVELKDLYIKCRIDIGNLHKENERLRKAGDAMAESIVYDDQAAWEDWGNPGKAELRDCVKGWIAAKEGSDAK